MITPDPKTTHAHYIAIGQVETVKGGSHMTVVIPLHKPISLKYKWALSHSPLR